MQIWIRRDKNNQLWLYTEKPVYEHNIDTYFPAPNSKMSRVNSHLFQDIPLDSKPLEYSIELATQPTDKVERHS